jgi:F0F1-type ATP synthase assembly protein I
MMIALMNACRIAKGEEPVKEKPKVLQAQSQPERYEKHEKGEKHEKHEKQEKQEKQAPEKYEKHEKRGIGFASAIIAGILLIILGVVIFLAILYNVSIPWGPIFLILAGIVIIVYGIMATSARRRSPPPPPA